ncbi:MAG: hypothetical protein KDA21_15795, partial [Phycisphaerales bacterium]|nr:hypothetical protein [Phycisphaerales bacterium]
MAMQRRGAMWTGWLGVFLALPSAAQPPAAAAPVRIEVGLKPAQAALWHHHDEGSGFLPLSFFRALRDAETGLPFLEALPRFGLVPDPTNAMGLPIGLSAASVVTAPHDSLQVGVSCSACHSGLWTYRGQSMVVDGAPNMLRFKGLLDALRSSLTATIESPSELLAFVDEILRHEATTPDRAGLFSLHPQARDLLTAAAAAAPEHPLAPMRRHLSDAFHRAYRAASAEAARGILEASGREMPLPPPEHLEPFERLREGLAGMATGFAYVKRHEQRLTLLAEAFSGSTDAGPGRADSFDAIWDLLVQKERVRPMDAPVSIPHLFRYATFHWVHWDGNSSTVMGRDHAQAVALGADLVPETLASSVLTRNIVELEQAAHGFTSPSWPEPILGTIDREKVARGKVTYARVCGSCHQGETLVPVADVGTDPRRAVNFAQLDERGASYAQWLIELGGALTDAAAKRSGVSPEEIAAVERSKTPTWRATGAYQARELAGVWA